MSGTIRIPPGGTVTLEISEEGMRIAGQEEPRSGQIQDPIGGPPLHVSNRVVPDAFALYVLSTCIIDCSRALESHEASVKEAADAQLKLDASYRRHERFNKAILTICGVLMLASLISLGMGLWTHFHGG